MSGRAKARSTSTAAPAASFFAFASHVGEEARDGESVISASLGPSLVDHVDEEDLVVDEELLVVDDELLDEDVVGDVGPGSGALEHPASTAVTAHVSTTALIPRM